MTTFEIRANALTVLVDAEDELDAISTAVDGEVLGEGDTGSVTEYDGRPVGADGTDPEDPDDDPRGPNPV